MFSTSPGRVVLLVALATNLLAGRASAYTVMVRDGSQVEAQAIARLEQGFALMTAEGVRVFAPGEIDFYGTFRANLDDEPGNVVAFARGGFMRFEDIVFVDEGLVRIEIQEDRSFTVRESIIDYRATVLEGALLELPAGFGPSAEVAKSTGPAPRASSRSGTDRRGRSSPSERARRVRPNRRAADKAAGERR